MAATSTTFLAQHEKSDSGLFGNSINVGLMFKDRSHPQVVHWDITDGVTLQILASYL